MNSGYKELLQQVQKDKPHFRDLHIVRFYSSYLAISERKVIAMIDPYMSYCPLVESLYKNIKFNHNHKEIKAMIKKGIQEKIKKFGHFTENREVIKNDIAVPYGASEMLMYAMRKKFIDAAVVVCEGAGTVIVDKPEIIQGIGARMHSVFFTTPINGIMNKLKDNGCHILSSCASIDQLEGVKKAASLGYKNIAVTINASMNESFSLLRQIEKSLNISIISLAICTTGINQQRIKEISKYADLAWSCASTSLREVIAQRAIVQVSKKIPVFVLTKKGLSFLSCYSSEKELIQNLDLNKQHIICNKGDIHVAEFRLAKRTDKDFVTYRPAIHFNLFLDNCLMVTGRTI